MTRLVFTRPANQDLIEIQDYIAQENPEAALQVMTQIGDDTLIYATLPIILRYARSRDGLGTECDRRFIGTISLRWRWILHSECESLCPGPLRGV